MEGLNRKEMALLKQLIAKAGGQTPRNITRRLTTLEVKRLEGKLALGEPVVVNFAKKRTIILCMDEYLAWTTASRAHANRMIAEKRGAIGSRGLEQSQHQPG